MVLIERFVRTPCQSWQIDKAIKIWGAIFTIIAGRRAFFDLPDHGKVSDDKKCHRQAKFCDRYDSGKGTAARPRCIPQPLALIGR